MKTVVISDRLSLSQPLFDVEIFSWHSRPSVENCPLVVLDLFFGNPTREGIVDLGNVNYNFYELGTEITRCLKSNGIVLALSGPVAKTERNLQAYSYTDITRQLKQNRLRDTAGPPFQFESSYDWLDQGFLQTTRLDTIHLKQTQGIRWLMPDSTAFHYRNFARSYWVSIHGINHELRRNKGHMAYNLQEEGRWNIPKEGHKLNIHVLAQANHTHLPVAVAIQNYLELPGVLVFLPPFVPEATPWQETAQRLLIEDFRSIGKFISELLITDVSLDRPNWIWDNRAPQAKALSENMESLEGEIRMLEEKRASYDAMLYLIDGTGTALVDAVARLFDVPSANLRVERTGKGASFDLFVHDGKGRTLAVEITGLTGVFSKNDSHLADFLEYIPEHHEKNLTERRERLVLIVNTHWLMPPQSRDRRSDITEPVRRTAKDNHICLIRSADLYQLWLKTLENVSPMEFFDSLFNAEGVYEPNT